MDDLPINNRRARTPCVKLTISVPLDMWNEARLLTPGVDAASHVVNIALATFIETRRDMGHGQD